MKTYPNKKYKFDPNNPPARVAKDLKNLEALIQKLRDSGVYFMADGSLHAFVRYEDDTRDTDYTKEGKRVYRPYDEAHIGSVSGNIDGGDFW
jgi:hypothetical protein